MTFGLFQQVRFWNMSFPSRTQTAGNVALGLTGTYGDAELHQLQALLARGITPSWPQMSWNLLNLLATRRGIALSVAATTAESKSGRKYSNLIRFCLIRAIDDIGGFHPTRFHDTPL